MCSRPEFISSDFGATLTLLEDRNGSAKWHFANTPARLSNVDMQKDKRVGWFLMFDMSVLVRLLDVKLIPVTVLRPGLFV